MLSVIRVHLLMLSASILILLLKLMRVILPGTLQVIMTCIFVTASIGDGYVMQFLRSLLDVRQALIVKVRQALDLLGMPLELGDSRCLLRDVCLLLVKRGLLVSVLVRYRLGV